MKKLILLFALLVVVSCKHQDEEREPSGPCGIVGSVDYVTQVKPIITAKCVGCHTEYKFYDKLNEACNNGTFQKRVLIQRDMPPMGGLDTCHYVVLKRWFRDGHSN